MRNSAAFFTTLLISVTAAAEDKPRQPIALPDSATAEVISLDFKGGYTPPRLKNSPTLSILADGTVLIPDNYGQSQNLKSKITPDELQELLSFIIDDQKFFDFNAKSVEKQVKESQKPKKAKDGSTVVTLTPVVADAPTTVIKVQTKNQKHEAQWYALSMAAGQHKDIPELARLREVELKLQRLMTIAHAGGSEEVAKQLKLVNDRVAAEHPDAPKLTADHLISASKLEDGSRRYFWQWAVQGKDGTAAQARYVNVQQQVPAKGEPTYMIDVKLK